MAAKEVIHFRFQAQLSAHSVFAARIPPEPVAQSPPKRNPFQFGRCCGLNFFPRVTNMSDRRSKYG